MTPRRFVLLDRDGTIIVEKHYLSEPSEVELLPNAANGLSLIREIGLGLVVITNQSAVGRGYFTEERLRLIHDQMRELLRTEGVELDGIYFCPHVPDASCDCRKPGTRLVFLAADELGFEPSKCFVIGDKPCDVKMGFRIGATTLLVRTGYGAMSEAEMPIRPGFVVDDLLDAARVIKCVVAQEGRHRRNG